MGIRDRISGVAEWCGFCLISALLFSLGLGFLGMMMLVLREIYRDLVTG